MRERRSARPLRAGGLQAKVRVLGRGPWREGVPGGRLRESCAIGLQLSVGGAFEGAGSWGAARGRHSEQERRGSSGLPVLEPVRKGRQLTRGHGPGRRLLGTLVLTGAPCGVGGSGGRGRGCPRLQRALRSMLRLPLRRGRGLRGRPWAKRPRPRARAVGSERGSRGRACGSRQGRREG